MTCIHSICSAYAAKCNGQLEYQDFLSFLSLDNRSISDVENRFRLFLQKKNNEGVRFAEQFQWFDKDETACACKAAVHGKCLENLSEYGIDKIKEGSSFIPRYSIRCGM